MEGEGQERKKNVEERSLYSFGSRDYKVWRLAQLTCDSHQEWLWDNLIDNSSLQFSDQITFALI